MRGLQNLEKDIKNILIHINNKVYFSELTFSPCGGFMPFVPEEWDAKLGEMVNIRKVK